MVVAEGFPGRVANSPQVAARLASDRCDACRAMAGAGWARKPHRYLAVIHKYRQPALEVKGADYQCTVCAAEWRRHRAGWRMLGE